MKKLNLLKGKLLFSLSWMDVIRAFFVIAAVLFLSSPLYAQEQVIPLPGQTPVYHSTTAAQRPTALTLPFFTDFTKSGSSPNSTLWEDFEVYLSNTMSNNQFSRGIAVFDANDSMTIPYDSLNPNHQLMADRLTARPIDLSSYHPGDSLWLSFYFEAEGNGFPPKPKDSFLLYFYNSRGRWEKVWSVGGNNAPTTFTRVLIPITDTGYFNNQFSFRFVNLATHGISNSNWLLDYVYLDAHRNYQDTVINDLAFTQNSSNLLNDFTAVPYDQFKTHPNLFLADSIKAHLRNNGQQTTTLNYGFEAKELLTGTNFAGQSGSQSIAANMDKTLSFPTFPFSQFNPPASSHQKVVIQTKYYAHAIYPNEPKTNDTITQKQIFDNYFAYDDGTAEKAYFLHVFGNAPGITAIEYALYAPDTLRGVAIYFPRTVPRSTFKEFSLIVYKTIAINGKRDNIIYQQDFYLPKFQDTINKFHIYRFNEPVAMDTGIYYIGVMQSAGGFSDSLYMGLDINRTTGNHRYYNVDGIWQPSLIQGAVMVRPVVGNALPPVAGINDTQLKNKKNWIIFPNPNRGRLHFKSYQLLPANSSFKVINVLGQVKLSGSLKANEVISLKTLPAGVYFFEVKIGNRRPTQKKFLLMGD